MENYFDQRAASWDSNPNRLKLAQSIYRFVSANVPLSRELEVLDYGCGTGLLSVLLAGDVKHITAADTSEEMLGQVRQKLKSYGIKNIEPAKFDICDGARRQARFDAAVSSMTLHHLPDAYDGMRGICGLVKYGGWAAFADLCVEDGSFHSDVAVKYNGFDPGELCGYMKELGFEDCRHEVVFEIPKNDRLYPVFCICGRKIKAN